VDIHFGPKPPKQKTNWIQSRPGKSWKPILRLTARRSRGSDKTWRPGEIERMAVEDNVDYGHAGRANQHERSEMKKSRRD